MLFTSLSVIGINLLTQIFKRSVKKYGETAIHVLIFILALIAVSIQAYFKGNPQYEALLQQAGIILGAAVALYEIALKKLFGKVNL